MINREAIELLKGVAVYADTEYKKALTLAIAALEQQNRVITVTDLEGGVLASISDKDIIEENGVHVIISEEEDGE